MPSEIFSRLLSDDGTTTGAKDASVDGSVTPQEFYIDCAAGERFNIERMLIQIGDDGINSLDTYGDIATLASGIELEVDKQSHQIDLLDGLPITSNGAWSRVCETVELDGLCNGGSFINAELTFSDSGANVILLPGDRLSIVVNDDMTGLNVHYFTVQGRFFY